MLPTHTCTCELRLLSERGTQIRNVRNLSKAAPDWCHPTLCTVLPELWQYRIPWPAKKSPLLCEPECHWYTMSQSCTHILSVLMLISILFGFRWCWDSDLGSNHIVSYMVRVHAVWWSGLLHRLTCDLNSPPTCRPVYPGSAIRTNYYEQSS